MRAGMRERPTMTLTGKRGIVLKLLKSKMSYALSYKMPPREAATWLVSAIFLKRFVLTLVYNSIRSNVSVSIWHSNYAFLRKLLRWSIDLCFAMAFLRSLSSALPSWTALKTSRAAPSVLVFLQRRRVFRASPFTV